MSHDVQISCAKFLTSLNVSIRTCLREAEILASQSRRLVGVFDEDPESAANDVKPHCRSRLTSLLRRWIADPFDKLMAGNRRQDPTTSGRFL